MCIRDRSKMLAVVHPERDCIYDEAVMSMPCLLYTSLVATKIRKNFGWLTAGIFALCIVCMPQLMNFYTQLRMYSCCLLYTSRCV